jgi:F-type H+-transporting ATPase subunit gamma
MTIGKKANDFTKKGSSIQSNKSSLFDDISFDKVSVAEGVG